MQRIAVLTSGGDAPGMNAAIRAVVRTGIDKGCEVLGVHHGYVGLIVGDVVPLGVRDVSGIIQQGGTMLGSARCPEFKTEEGRSKALRTLQQHDVEALVVIGGSGSQTGAQALSQMGFPVVGVASTIDNDLYGSEITIGVDTALNIALEAIDRLKVTASSHHRAFLVEVMGRECGYLALMAGIAGGAEAVIIPEVETDPEAVATELRAAYERGKSHALVVVAEGAKLEGKEVTKTGKPDEFGHVYLGGIAQLVAEEIAFEDATGARRIGAGTAATRRGGEAAHSSARGTLTTPLSRRRSSTSHRRRRLQRSAPATPSAPGTRTSSPSRSFRPG